MGARVEAGEGPGAGMVGGRQEEEEGFGGFDAICDGIELSGPTWRACPGAPISALYLGWIRGVPVSLDV